MIGQWQLSSESGHNCSACSARFGALWEMRDKINTITDEITKLLDLQIELFQKQILDDLPPKELDQYHTRRDRIHQLCSELSDLSA